MKRYTASQARQHLSEVLDAAERGESVMIERGERRFVLKAEKRSALKRAPASRVVWMDPAVESGQWTWEQKQGEPQFTPRKRGQRK